MFALALKFDASINAERFTSAAAPVMRLSRDQSIVEYRAHFESLKSAVDGLDDCFAADGEQDAQFRAEQRRELEAMQSMTPEQWRSMEGARKYREQWNRYHAAKLNPALRYTFPVCIQLLNWPAVRKWSIITMPGARRERLPYGIRNSAGFVCFFAEPTYFDGQDERYAEECEALRKNADIMCAALNNA